MESTFSVCKQEISWTTRHILNKLLIRVSSNFLSQIKNMQVGWKCDCLFLFHLSLYGPTINFQPVHGVPPCGSKSPSQPILWTWHLTFLHKGIFKVWPKWQLLFLFLSWSEFKTLAWKVAGNIHSFKGCWAFHSYLCILLNIFKIFVKLVISPWLTISKDHEVMPPNPTKSP